MNSIIQTWVDEFTDWTMDRIIVLPKMIPDAAYRSADHLFQIGASDPTGSCWSSRGFTCGCGPLLSTTRARSKRRLLPFVIAFETIRRPVPASHRQSSSPLGERIPPNVCRHFRYCRPSGSRRQVLGNCRRLEGVWAQYPPRAGSGAAELSRATTAAFRSELEVRPQVRADDGCRPRWLSSESETVRRWTDYSGQAHAPTGRPARRGRLFTACRPRRARR